MGKIIERVRQRNAKRQSMIAENNSLDRLIAEQICAQNRRSAMMNANRQIDLQNDGYSFKAAASLANSEEAKRWNEAGSIQLVDTEPKPKSRKWWKFW